MIGLISKVFQDSFRKSHPNHDVWSSTINASACSRRSWLSVNGLVPYIGRKTAAPHIEYIVHFPTCISFYRRLSCMICAWTAVPHQLDVAVRHRMLAAGDILANSRSMEPLSCDSGTCPMRTNLHCEHITISSNMTNLMKAFLHLLA